MGRTRKAARLRLEKLTVRMLTEDEAAAVVGGVGGGNPNGHKEIPGKLTVPAGRELSSRCLG